MSDGINWKREKVGTVSDIDGDAIAIGTTGNLVILGVGGEVHLDAAQQEEFAQLYVAACHQAKANAEAARAAMPGQVTP
jgi:hypothetical protein